MRKVFQSTLFSIGQSSSVHCEFVVPLSATTFSIFGQDSRPSRESTTLMFDSGNGTCLRISCINFSRSNSFNLHNENVNHDRDLKVLLQKSYTVPELTAIDPFQTGPAARYLRDMHLRPTPTPSE